MPESDPARQFVQMLRRRNDRDQFLWSARNMSTAALKRACDWSRWAWLLVGPLQDRHLSGQQ